jgi:hypothetical protein
MIMKKALYILLYFFILLVIMLVSANIHYLFIGFIPVCNLLFSHFQLKKLYLIADATILFIISGLFMFYFKSIITLDLIIFILFNTTNILSVAFVLIYNYSGRKKK